jgi:ABC-type multidrug transport system fused ATPase/permease subunit
VSSIPFLFWINISDFFSYLTLYTLVLVFLVLTYLGAMLFYYVGTQRASRSINGQLVDSVLGSTLRSVSVAGLGFHILTKPCSSWLDETPTSRIITRCTQDIATIDGSLTWSFGSVVEICVEMATKLGGPVLFTPIFLIPGVSIAFLGVYIGNIYLKAQMSVKREKR